MIEPDMATLITLLFTDADIDAVALDAIFRRVIDRTFNCVSIDTDTSTSDTAIVIASGAAGRVESAEFEHALYEVAESLTKQVARDGEGAETLIEVQVDGARDDAQAKRVAKAIVNSPLVKTAVHGADPNWGRVAMAIGKCSDDVDIDERNVVIRFGDTRCTRASRRSRSRRAVALHVQRRRDASTSASGSPTARQPCGAATSPTATSASTPTTRHSLCSRCSDGGLCPTSGASSSQRHSEAETSRGQASRSRAAEPEGSAATSPRASSSQRHSEAETPRQVPSRAATEGSARRAARVRASVTAKRRRCARQSSLRRHADAAIDADGLGVHVAVGDALDDHRGQFLGGAEAVREEHALLAGWP